MPGRFLRLHGTTTSANRLAVVARVREVLGRYAWIMDHHNLADVWMTIHFEVRPGHFLDLIKALQSVEGLKVWTEESAPVPEPDRAEAPGEDLAGSAIPGALQICFASDVPR